MSEKKDPLVETLGQVTAALEVLGKQAAVLKDVVKGLDERLGAQRAAQQRAERPAPQRRKVAPTPTEEDEMGEEDRPMSAFDEELASTDLGLPPVVDISPQARFADLKRRIEIALTRESLTTDKLARAVGESLDKVVDALRTLRAESRVYNVGMGDAPLWTWRIGDHTDTQDLKKLVVRLLMERPMTTRELANATGARMSRVGGVMVDIQRGNYEVINLGHGHTGRWYITATAAVKPHKIPGRWETKPKANKGKGSKREPDQG